MPADDLTLFDLRGNFVDPYLQNFQSEQLQYLYGLTDAFALDDKRALIVAHAKDCAQVRNTCVILINIRSQEVYWRITCRLSYRAALDKEQGILALASQEAFALWNLRNGQLLHNIDLEYDTATDMAFSPDGSLLAVAMYDGDVQLWYAVDGTPGHVLHHQLEYGASKSIAFSPDGKYLASGTRESEEVWLWNVADGRLLRMMETHPHAEPTTCAMSFMIY